MANRYLLLTLTHMLIFCAHAQTGPASGMARPLQELSIAQWTANEGLSSNNVTSIFQSSDGLMWITSFNGFMHFDGQRTEVFDRNSLSLLETDGFYIAIQDSGGRVWLGSQASGIIQYDSGKFQTFVPTSGAVPKSIRTLFVAADGSIFIGASNMGLHRIEGTSVSQIHHPDLDNITVMNIAEDRSGVLWIATDGEGLFSLERSGNMSKYTTKNGLLSNSIAALRPGRDGGIWIGSNQGLQRMVHGEITTVGQLSSNQVNALCVDQRGNIWVGAERGLARYDEKTDQIDWLYSKNNIDLVRISHIIFDREENLWVSSNRSGIIRLKETNITNLTRPLLSSDRTNIVHEGSDGKLYIGTDANDVDVCYKGNCTPLHIRTPVGGNGIRDIYTEDDGSIWLATYSGLIIRKKDGSERILSRKDGMPAEDFRVIHRDRKGNFWFGSRSGGLVKYRDNKIVRVFDHNSGLQSNYILSVTEDKDGKIYAGTHSGGLSIIDDAGAISTYHVRADDAGILIFNIDIDDQGRIWPMSNIGPLYFDGKALQQIELSPDKRSKTYFDWIEDKQGNMWITTSIGLLQTKKIDVLGFIHHEIKEVPFYLQDDSDGMNNKECTGATRSLLTSAGEIYIPTLGGVCNISPKEERRNTIVPPVQIAHFRTDNIDRPLFVPTQAVKAGFLRYAFQFRVLSFAAPDRNKYRHRLEGLDKGWSAATSLGEVEYTNLPPGDYVFKVIGSNDNDVWNNKGASLAFTVKPFFYQTVWFYVLIIMVALLIFYGLYLWRISFIREQNLALRKVNAELDRFVYSASHDLRSPLLSLMGLITIARADKENQEQYLSLMEKSVRKLDSFIRDIIEFSRNARLEVKPEPIDFGKMVNDILEDLHFMDNFDKITKTINVDVPHPFLTDEKRLRVTLSNIIANAIKHHWLRREQPLIAIDVHQQPNHGVIIQVRDNGPGIPAEHLDDIFKMFFRATDKTSGSGLGLYIVKETLQRLKGDISVTSVVEEGTAFTIHLPSLSS